MFWLGPPSLVVPVSVCGVSFFLCRQSFFLLPLLLLGVGWALAEPLLVWLLCLWSWGTCSFPLSVLQWLQVGCPTPEVDLFVGLVGSWYSTWFSTLCQRGFPLAGSAPSPFCCLPFAGAAPFQAPVCGSTSAVGPCGWVGVVFAASLGFSPMCRALPQVLQLAQLSQLQVTLGFSGHRVSVLLPW